MSVFFKPPFLAAGLFFLGILLPGANAEIRARGAEDSSNKLVVGVGDSRSELLRRNERLKNIGIPSAAIRITFDNHYEFFYDDEVVKAAVGCVATTHIDGGLEFDRVEFVWLRLCSSSESWEEATVLAENLINKINLENPNLVDFSSLLRSADDRDWVPVIGESWHVANRQVMSVEEANERFRLVKRLGAREAGRLGVEPNVLMGAFLGEKIFIAVNVSERVKFDGGAGVELMYDVTISFAMRKDVALKDLQAE